MAVVDALLVAAFLFFVGSVIGWCIEILFRRIFTAKKWINPGFLTGPYLPLYGFGVAGLFGISQIPIETGSVIWNAVVTILLMGVTMTLIEYIAGLIFIKGMKIKLWDYSDRKGNIQGIICPLFSFCWLLVSAFFYFVIEPFALDAVVWFVSNIAFAFVVGLFFGVFFVDLGHSINLSAKIRAFAKENKVIISFEKFKAHVKEHIESVGKKASFIFPFKSHTINDELEHYSAQCRGEITQSGADDSEK